MNESAPVQETKPSEKDRKRALDLFDAAQSREKEFDNGWWKVAKTADEIFNADKNQADGAENIPYNILYSNTEVLLPALYSATPKPDVRSRFKGVDIKPLPEVIERFLTVAADPANPGADCFDNSLRDCVLSSLVPGMGYVRIRYVEDRAFPLVYESGHYRTFLWAKAPRWAKVPWVAFKHPMKKEQLFSQFEVSEEDQSNFTPSSEDDETKDDCCVYEIWDKKSKKIYFVSEEWSEKLLKTSDDPLGLENFFPTPGPLVMTDKPGKLLPTPLYVYYKNQAEELNRVSVRLDKVLSAIRVRGAYNGLLGDDISKILGDENLENALVPAQEAGLLAQTGGFEKQIWMLPIDMLITVARELYTAREAIKQVIYELTGISDIIRGSSVASETATAQDLKNKWGTVRLRRMQTAVANYARDLFRMSVDCGSDHIPAAKWKEIVQMPIPTAEEQDLAKQTLMYSQATGGQPDPKQMQVAQSPITLDSLLDKIKNDMNRTFVVNIQTSSTIDLDTAQDKAEVSEFMNAMGQLLPGLQGLAAIGPTGMAAAKSILMAVCQRFKFGIDMADVIGQIEAPPPPAAPEKPTGPPPPSPEELQAKQLEDQGKIAAAQARLEVIAAEKDLALTKIAGEKEKFVLGIQETRLKLEEQKRKLAMPVPAKKGVPNANV